MKILSSLRWALQQHAMLQGTKLDRMQLEAVLPLGRGYGVPQLADILRGLDLPSPIALDEPDQAHLPLLCCLGGEAWGVVMDRDAEGRWVVAFDGGARSIEGAMLRGNLVLIRQAPAKGASGTGFRVALNMALREYRGVIAEAMLASVFIGLISLVISLFSMQVYDRVIPTRSEHTLIILSIGVVLAVFLEMAMKIARSKIMDSVVTGMDGRLSRDIFQRLLDLRVDQVPRSVGSLAGQIRGYEQVRSFYTASTLFALVDLPMGILFMVIVAVIGAPILILAPLCFGAIALVAGFVIRLRIQRLALVGAAASHLKTGLLVEAVEGAETIKAGLGGWKFLSRWIGVSGQTIQNDLQMRNANEGLGYLAATLQQLSYAAVIVLGAWVVMRGEMTMGALIACSILSGRIMSPILAMPGLLVQHAHCKAAMVSLEQLYALESDHHGQYRPLLPTSLEGEFLLKGVQFSYPESPISIHVGALHIKPGEKVGVLGPIGAGKSTLLRLLGGLYHPQQGRVLIDGLDMAQVSRQVLSQQIGYLQQDHRLFEGSLRENLLIGLPDPGDEVLKKTLSRSGLLRLVSAHPRGLELPIKEGGKGLSGGQRQLVAFTRLLLCNPAIWLLDEPTANMDEDQERNCISILHQELDVDKTLVLVTHKGGLLRLVDRIIVVADQQIVMDGPRDQVLMQLVAKKTQQPAISRFPTAVPRAKAVAN